jgi:hypothetical protein
VLTVNVPLLDPAATVTENGMNNADKPLLVNPTTAAPSGAAFDSVTLQLLVAFGPKVVGLHWSEDSTAAEAKVKLIVCEVPL